MYIRGAVDKYDRETSEYIVAYLDILGTSSRMDIEKERQMLNLNKLHNLYTATMENTKSDMGIEWYKGIKFMVFSDNIIIAKKLSQVPSERVLDIKSVLNCASHFQISSVGDGVGVLVRGGITIGELFMDNVMVWGAALLRAYKIEDSLAIYPRVVIDTAIISELQHSKDTADYLSLDFDGLWFLNYMSIWHFAGQPVKSGFEIIKADARNNNNGQYPDRIYQNLYWHMLYINNELDKKRERKDNKYRLNIE